MQTRATARFVRMSPQKVRLVTRLISKRPVEEAVAILRFTNKRAARVVSKVLLSAVANAENNYGMDRDELVVAQAVADEGPSLPKRFRAKARGQFGTITKRTSHVTVVVDDGR